MPVQNMAGFYAPSPLTANRVTINGADYIESEAGRNGRLSCRLSCGHYLRHVVMSRTTCVAPSTPPYLPTQSTTLQVPLLRQHMPLTRTC